VAELFDAFVPCLAVDPAVDANTDSELPKFAPAFAALEEGRETSANAAQAHSKAPRRTRVDFRYFDAKCLMRSFRPKQETREPAKVG
jgi:hypothetical protein